jgi:hypothetical protein
MTTAIFMEFLGALDASIGVQGGDILVFTDSYAAYPS